MADLPGGMYGGAQRSLCTDPVIATTSDPLVSCLCPTWGRVSMLRRAIACFLRQTYEPRELVVIYRIDDAETKDYLATLGEQSIRAIEIAASPWLGPGALRNMAMEAARGHYVAVWDDDDWYGPTRLAEQIRAISVAGKPGCVLTQLVLYDGATQSAFLSAERTWENSLVAEREAVPAYSGLPRGSDAEVIHRMVAEDLLVGLHRPDLYIYTYHGENVWDRDHWEKNLLAHAHAMAASDTERVKSVLQEGALVRAPGSPERDVSPVIPKRD
jgi:glycosyltransferase involved in cell wall biosynthesis